MDNIFAVTSKFNIGSTFVDWSIHFLSGKDKFYHRKLGWIPLTNNPLTEKNAHGHFKNHPHGKNEVLNCINLLQKQNALTSMYAVPMYFADAANALQINLDNSISENDSKKILEYIDNDYREILSTLGHNNIKVIYLRLPENLFLYIKGENRSNHASLKQVDHSALKESYITQEQIDKDFDDLFFPQSQKIWEELGLNHIWDKRERMALDHRPFQNVLTQNFDYSIPNIKVDINLFWANSSDIMFKILDFLGLKLDQTRYQYWLPIMEKWKSLQHKKINFAINYQHIMDSIINNWHTEIDLEFYQEVIIQHSLLYHYGLNLKTWQLEKFPKNTRDLHKLLEPNFHPLTEY